MKREGDVFWHGCGGLPGRDFGILDFKRSSFAMAHLLPADLKERAEKICAEYGYLEVQDPGTVLVIDGRTLVFVLDNEGRGLWLEV